MQKYLKGKRDETDGGNDHESREASRNEPSPSASHEFRHWSPPIFHAQTQKGVVGSSVLSDARRGLTLLPDAIRRSVVPGGPPLAQWTKRMIERRTRSRGSVTPWLNRRPMQIAKSSRSCASSSG